MRYFGKSSVVLVGLAACGEGGYGEGASTTPSAANASSGRIWNGIDSLTGLSVVGHFAETGEFHLIQPDSAQYIGTAAISGYSVIRESED
jgi:hypothetical protein